MATTIEAAPKSERLALETLRLALSELLRTERQVRGRESRVGSNLSLAHLRVLASLERAPNRVLAVGQLAAASGLTTAGATRLVDVLERAGIVERVRSEDDRRSVLIRLTRFGLNEFRARSKRYLDCWEEAFAGFSEADIEQAINVVERIRGFFECASGSLSR
jgi:MarR family transcriptional regulator, organic hydroperoxide resistance regulator